MRYISAKSHILAVFSRKRAQRRRKSNRGEIKLLSFYVNQIKKILLHSRGVFFLRKGLFFLFKTEEVFSTGRGQQKEKKDRNDNSFQLNFYFLYFFEIYHNIKREKWRGGQDEEQKTFFFFIFIGP